LRLTASILLFECSVIRVDNLKPFSSKLSTLYPLTLKVPVYLVSILDSVVRCMLFLSV